eukprot:COSAG05_NODE_18110_length_313_cov_1.429907_1_plen_93_part_10
MRPSTAVLQTHALTWAAKLAQSCGVRIENRSFGQVLAHEFSETSAASTAAGKTSISASHASIADGTRAPSAAAEGGGWMALIWHRAESRVAVL